MEIKLAALKAWIDADPGNRIIQITSSPNHANKYYVGAIKCEVGQGSVSFTATSANLTDVLEVLNRDVFLKVGLPSPRLKL